MATHSTEPRTPERGRAFASAWTWADAAPPNSWRPYGPSAPWLLLLPNDGGDHHNKLFTTSQSSLERRRNQTDWKSEPSQVVPLGKQNYDWFDIREVAASSEFPRFVTFLEDFCGRQHTHTHKRTRTPSNTLTHNPSLTWRQVVVDWCCWWWCCW